VRKQNAEGKRIPPGYLARLRNTDYKHLVHSLRDSVISGCWRSLEIVGLIIVGLGVILALAGQVISDLLFGREK
jgi:hypothetical protein